MTELTRTLRFCPGGDPTATRHNAFVAWPPTGGGLAGVVELRVTLAGSPDPVTGLLVNVKEIDDVFARDVLPGLNPASSAVALLRDAARAFTAALGPPAPASAPASAPAQAPAQAPAPSLRLRQVSFHPAPGSVTALDPAHMNRVLLRQRFTFSAAHRLVAPALSEARNQALFGKCHRPSFHGHNYELEVAAEAEVDTHGRSLCPTDLDAAVKARVLDHLDHRNLNLDVPEFAERNPTVEHIAATCFGRLDGHLPGGARLREVTVWETDRTSCTHRAEDPPLS